MAFNLPRNCNIWLENVNKCLYFPKGGFFEISATESSLLIRVKRCNDVIDLTVSPPKRRIIDDINETAMPGPSGTNAINPTTSTGTITCNICYDTAIEPVFGVCCQQVLGCKACINKCKECPLCRARLSYLVMKGY